MSAEPIQLPIRRDYHAEYLAAFEASIPADGCYVLPVLVQAMNDRLRKTDPDLLRGWLIEHLDILATAYFGKVANSRRSRVFHQLKPSIFAKAVGRHEAGDADAFGSILDLPYFVGELYKPLRTLTAADLELVAAAYDERSASNAFEAAFIRAVAKKVKADKTVEDCLTAEQIGSIRAAIG